jgi:hypothetical protein
MTITDEEFARYVAAGQSTGGHGSAENLNTCSGCRDAARAWLDANPLPTFTHPTTVAELQTGDVVRLVGQTWATHEGTTAVVESGSWARAEGGYRWFLDDNSWPWEFVSRPGQETATSEPTTPRVEVPEGLEFTEYHPALLPLFTKAALAADAAGYCSEYDQIAAEIGAPSRDEIKQLAGKPHKVVVPLTVNVEIEVSALDSEGAIRQVRSGDFSTFDGIRDLIAASIGVNQNGQTWGGPVAQHVTGYQSQYQDRWSVTPAE